MRVALLKLVYTKRAPTSFGQPFGHPMGDKILRLPTLKNIQCSRKEYIFIRCYFNNFIFIYCDCIRLHNFCMGGYMDRPANTTSLGRSHKTAERR